MSEYGELSATRYITRKDDDYRRPFGQDRDRILYSRAFRRLAGVTQVAAVSERRLLHNRLTHSLKVAQIGRRLAEWVIRDNGPNSKLKTNPNYNPDIVETAGLAHDLGHPPFGHSTEEVLERLIKENEYLALEGFEGNAQTFRIISKLAVHKGCKAGLDLTRGTLSGILKYPCLKARSDEIKVALEQKKEELYEQLPSWTDRAYGIKWGAFTSESDDLTWVRAGKQSSDLTRSVAAILMDWADDISYATTDIEDYYCAGLIPLDKLDRDALALGSHGMNRLRPERYKQINPDDFHRALDEVVKFATDTIERPYQGTRDDRCCLQEFISGNIGRFIEAVTIIDDPPFVEIDAEAQYRVEALKELNWYYVIDNPSLAAAQLGQEKLIKTLFEALIEHLERTEKPNSSKRRVPTDLKDLYDSIAKGNNAPRDLETDAPSRRARAVCDYICSLTENQAIDLYERISGVSRASFLGSWVSG